MDTTTYEFTREQMQTGDLLAVHGTGLVSWVIEAWTHSPYSHVGMLLVLIVGGIRRVFLIQATAKEGVNLLPVSRYLSGLRGLAWWVPLRQHDDTKATALLSTAMLQLGRPYDHPGIWHYLLPWVQPDPTARYCSELAASLYQQIGLIEKSRYSPAELLRLPLFDPPVSLA